MKLKKLLVLLCIVLLCSMSLMALSISGSYVPATAERGIWHLWSDLSPDIQAYYNNYRIGNRQNALFYHLGKLTIDIKPDGNPPIYYIVLNSPYSTNSIRSTATWEVAGQTHVSQVQLAIGIKKNNVVLDPQVLALNADSWGNWLQISGPETHTEISQDTRIEVEFYLYTTWGLESYAKDSPIYFQDVNIQMASLQYSYDSSNNNRKDLILDNSTNEFDYWGGMKVPPTEETYRNDADKPEKQTLALSVVENTEMIDSGKSGVEQPVAKLEITTSNNKTPSKDYNLKIAMYDNDPVGTGHSLYYLHLDDDKSNHNAFLVTLDVAGQKTLNDPTQTITLSVPKGETIPIRKLVNASFVNTDNLNLPAGNYRDTVYVDIITGDS